MTGFLSGSVPAGGGGGGEGERGGDAGNTTETYREQEEIL